MNPASGSGNVKPPDLKTPERDREPTEHYVLSPSDRQDPAPSAIADIESPEERHFVNAEPKADDVRKAARAVTRDLDSDTSEQASLAAIRDLPCSVTLANPCLEDCPLIGCSDGFETVTGYQRREIVGQNCRFLNRGTGIDPSLLARIREAVHRGLEFIGIVPNMRKNGERFLNLLHMSAIEVHGRKYIIGIQADVTHVNVNLNAPGHIEALRATAEIIFEGNINAWVQMQAREFAIRLPAPYSQLLKLCAPEAFQHERDRFVRLGPPSECDEDVLKDSDGLTAVNTCTDQLQAQDVRKAARAAGHMDRDSSQEASLLAISLMPCSVTLADPNLEDCPLIGCSDGFETMTGYQRREIIGRNCRFLNRGTGIEPAMLTHLRDAVASGREFIGIVPNARKSGERFLNLLHMSSLAVRGRKYIIGIQADVTNVDVDLNTPGHVEALTATAERIFEGHIDAWVQMQAREFSIRLPAPYSQLLKLCAPETFRQECDDFVKLGVIEDLQEPTTKDQLLIKRPDQLEAVDVRNAARAARDLDAEAAEQASLAAIRGMPCSVTLADPSLEDCPLIGCSDGFEALTGYERREIVGQNCRFLNKESGIDPALLARLREAVQLGLEFIGIVPNLRKNGERFENLLHMSALLVRGRRYIIGIQADVTHVNVNLNCPGHVEALRATAELIFEGSINAWVQMQCREFAMRLPAPYSQLLKLCSPEAFQQERDAFVRLGPSEPDDGLMKERASQSVVNTRTDQLEAVDVRKAARAAARDMDLNSAEQASLAAIRNMPCSVTLADPNLDDCPLIGCSDGFEVVTGYQRREIIGQNCRFLNRGSGIDPALLARLREAVHLGREFIGIVPNLRKNGEKFLNLLHMTSLKVCGRKYIIGIQADVTHVEVNLNTACHVEALRATAERIFESNINAWVQMQAREFSIRLPATYSQLLKLSAPDTFRQERDHFVSLGPAEPSIEASRIFQEAPPARHRTDIRRGENGREGDTESGEPSSGSAPVREQGTLVAKEGQDWIALHNMQAAGGPKSLGSIDHPNSCKECHFHIFSPGGCRAGRNCRFCHELHPRLNPKKNRKLVKKLIETGIVPQEVVAQRSTNSLTRQLQNAPVSELVDLQSSSSTAPVVRASNGLQDSPESSAEAHISDSAQGRSFKAPTWHAQSSKEAQNFSGLGHAEGPAFSGSSPSRSESTGPASSGKESMRFSYSREDPSDNQSGPRSNTLVVGVRCHHPPIIHIQSERFKALRNHMEFTIDPALPEGLTIDKTTGVISGLPMRAQEVASVHTISAIVEATGPGGVPLGSLTLGSCIFACHIVDLRCYILSWAEDGEEDQLVLKLQKI